MAMGVGSRRRPWTIPWVMIDHAAAVGVLLTLEHAAISAACRVEETAWARIVTLTAGNTAAQVIRVTPASRRLWD